MRSTVSEKGQVTIPKALRDRLGIGPGQVLDFDEDNGRLVARKVTHADPVDGVYGILDLPEGTDRFLALLRNADTT
jgi:antitoxin PrlF